MQKLLRTALVTFLFACGSPSEEAALDSTEQAVGGALDARVIRSGKWGGEHVSLTASKTGGTLEYDCAVGTIDEVITLDKSGNFDLTGTHTLEHGGPGRPGDTADIHPARYTGKVVGSKMTLSVELTDSKTKLGPYTLTLGAAPHILKCV